MKRIFLIIFSFLIPFVVYIIFLCPTIAGGDSGELVTASYVMGIAHPPGYPLYTLLGKLFTFIPFYSVAWRVNLLSAFCSSMCCMFIYLSLVKLTNNASASLCGSFSLAFSRYFWHYSEVSEVFPLNNLFVSLLIYMLILWRDNLNNDRYLYLTAFFFGLSLTNHHTIILLLPCMVFFLIYNKKNIVFQKKTLILSACLFLAGLLPYIYLPLAAMKNPPLNWKNPVNFKNFKGLVLRENYGSMSLIPKKFLKENNLKVPPLHKKLSAYLISFYNQFRITGFLTGITGFIYLFFRDLPLNIFLFTGIFFSGFFFVSIANMPFEMPLLIGVLQRFYIMSAVIFSIYTGFGVKFLLDFIDKLLLSASTRHPASGSQHPSVNFLLNAVTLKKIVYVTVFFICFFLPFISNMDEADFRNNYLALDYGKNILSPLPQDSILFVKGDLPSMTVDYLQMVEGYRRDIKVIDYVRLKYDWYTEEIKKRYPDVIISREKYENNSFVDPELIAMNINRFEIFATESQKLPLRGKFREILYGMTLKISDEDEGCKSLQKQDIHFVLRGLDRDYEETSWESEIKRQYIGFGIIRQRPNPLYRDFLKN